MSRGDVLGRRPEEVPEVGGGRDRVRREDVPEAGRGALLHQPGLTAIVPAACRGK